MKRHYNWEYIKNILEKTKNIKRDDWINISIWADIIVWFPGEDNSDFEKTLNLVKNIWIQKIHAFPFSWHKIWETVPAWKYEWQINNITKKERMKILTELSDKIKKDFIESQIWKTLEVLIESIKNWEWKWWTQNYIEANQDNFEIISWVVRKNEVVVGKLK
jgi:tRNA A37 methylthiotransferase MiaB